MLKKYRALLILLLILVVGVFACCAAFVQDAANSTVSIQVNGYHIDFMYDWDLEFFKTLLKVTRSDGKSAETMKKMQLSDCSQLAIQQIGTRIYFRCSSHTISAETDYLDTETMALYDGERNTLTPIDSLDFR